MPVFGNKQKEPEAIDVLGKPFTCPACQHDLFHQGKAQLNTRSLTLLNLDWANRSATYISCARCGHMSWFSQQ